MKNEKIRKALGFILIVIGPIILWTSLTAKASYAEDYCWIGGTGSWFDDASWDSYGVPRPWVDNAFRFNF